MDKIFETAKQYGKLVAYTDYLVKLRHIKAYQGSNFWRAALLRNMPS